MTVPILALFLFTGILCANPAWAAENGGTLPRAEETLSSPAHDGSSAPVSPGPAALDQNQTMLLAQVPSLAEYGKDVVPDLAQGTARIFSRENLAPALVGLGATALAFTLDDEVKDYFQERQPMDRVSKYGKAAGKYYYRYGIGAALAGAGRLANNRQLSDTGIVVLESVFITDAATLGLKYLTNRPRPNRRDRQSFPSGHASGTAALSASISEMYDWHPGVAIPLYAATLFVGASRLQDNTHHLSDVTAGIALGTIVGRGMARHQKEKRKKGGKEKHISFTPLFEDGIKGGMFTMKW